MPDAEFPLTDRIEAALHDGPLAFSPLLARLGIPYAGVVWRTVDTTLRRMKRAGRVAVVRDRDPETGRRSGPRWALVDGAQTSRVVPGLRSTARADVHP